MDDMCMHIEMKVEQLAAIHTTKTVIQYVLQVGFRQIY
jgi:hypothetical protein